MSWWRFVGAIADGVLSVPMDVYYGGRRTLEDVGVFGSEVQKANAEERDRIVGLIKKVINNRSLLEQLVSIIIDDFSNRLSEESIDKLRERAGSLSLMVGGRVTTQILVSMFLGKELVKRIAISGITALVARLGTGLALSALLVQGLIERASNASQRLERANPAVSSQLRKADLDMLYFIVEDSMAPFVAFDGSEESLERIFQRLDEMK